MVYLYSSKRHVNLLEVACGRPNFFRGKCIASVDQKGFGNDPPCTKVNESWRSVDELGNMEKKQRQMVVQKEIIYFCLLFLVFVLFFILCLFFLGFSSLAYIIMIILCEAV